MGYDDDSTLMAVVPSPDVRLIVAETLIRDLGRVSEWCDLCGMNSNASKTKTIMVSKSRTMHHCQTAEGNRIQTTKNDRS